jgi:hypothetical protein
MRRVEIAVTCDPCLAWKGLDVAEGVETVPVVGGHTIDLCAEHRDGMRAVLALIGEYADGAAVGIPATSRLDKRTRGRVERAVEKASKPTRRGGKRERARREAHAAEAAVVVEGLACPLCAENRPTSDAMSTHLRSAHGLTPEAVYGLACPMCGREAATGRALGTHGRRDHGSTDGVPGLFALAATSGDPLGIVAARARALATEAGGE